MQLYATVTSERATKGQGGNNFLDVKLTVGSEQAQVLRLLFNATPGETDKYCLFTPVIQGELWVLRQILDATNQAIALKKAEKGEKQKGENVGNCYMDVFGKKCLLTDHKH